MTAPLLSIWFKLLLLRGLVGMGQLVRVFKPDSSAVWVFRAMVFFGLCVALAGFASHHAAISCAGIFLLTVFSALTFKQSSQTIQIFNDRVIFSNAGQDAWTIPFDSFSKLEVATTYKNVSKYSPGRTILLRFLDRDDKLCAEANVNVFDKSAIRAMIELINSSKPGLLLNKQAHELLQDTAPKSTTMGAVTKTE
ncbi:MAG: hypothetical protein HYX67_15375 [Candidatus Melainabacteria bacterium]|nr:hypothetical protein [Candidatus Melainabacteria bacterium]